MSDRQHGTRTMYVHGRCRRDADCPNATYTCAQANRDYSVRNHRARHQGRVALVDARGVRAHIRRLGEAGVGYKRVAQLAGVSSSAVGKILSGETRRVRPATVVRILGVRVDHADNALVDAALAWQRIDELLAAGYSKAWISRQLGTGGRALQLSRDRITARNAKAVARLYHSLLAPDGKPWPPRPKQVAA